MLRRDVDRWRLTAGPLQSLFSKRRVTEEEEEEEVIVVVVVLGLWAAARPSAEPPVVDSAPLLVLCEVCAGATHPGPD